MNNTLERIVEIVLSVGTVGFSMWGTLTEHLTGQQGMVLIVASFAIYQSTSIAKIFKTLKE